MKQGQKSSDNKKKKIFREVCVLTVGTACTKLYFSVQKGTISKMVPFFNIGQITVVK